MLHPQSEGREGAGRRRRRREWKEARE